MRLLLLLLLLAASAAPAAAQSNGNRVPVTIGGDNRDSASRPPPPTSVAEPVALFIAGCDADGDGMTTRDELSRCLARTFAALDTARQGAIGYIQYGDWAKRWLGDATALPTPFEIDADGDNRITLTEMQARFDAIFTRLDTAKDGRLTHTELLTVRSGLNETGDHDKRRRR